MQCRNRLWHPSTTSRKYPRKAGAGDVTLSTPDGKQETIPIQVIFPNRSYVPPKFDDVPKYVRTTEISRYEKWRYKIIIRDHKKCILCNSTDWIQVHHIVRWIDDKELRYDLRNGVCVCLVCHQKNHGPQMQPFPKAVTDKLNDYINKLYRMRPLKNEDYVIGDPTEHRIIPKTRR